MYRTPAPAICSGSKKLFIAHTKKTCVLSGLGLPRSGVPTIRVRLFLQSAAASAAFVIPGTRAALAENAPGVTDTEIKIGQTMPYSGPASPTA